MRNPIIWGPDYTSGVSVFGRIGKFDYAAELKNTSLSARPEYWSAAEVQWEHPTVSGRVGFRPNQMWNLGFSASVGSYLQELATERAHFLEDVGARVARDQQRRESRQRDESLHGSSSLLRLGQRMITNLPRSMPRLDCTVNR